MGKKEPTRTQTPDLRARRSDRGDNADGAVSLCTVCNVHVVMVTIRIGVLTPDQLIFVTFG